VYQLTLLHNLTFSGKFSICEMNPHFLTMK